MFGHSGTEVHCLFCSGDGFDLSGLIHIDDIAFFSVVSNFKDHLHIVGGTESTNFSVDIISVWGRDEINVLSRFELEASGDGTERPEGDGEVLEALRFVTNSHNLWSRVGYPAGIKLLLGDTVDHMFLLGVEWTDDVDLVVLPGKVSLVNIHNMLGVINPKYRIGWIPENQMAPHSLRTGHYQRQNHNLAKHFDLTYSVSQHELLTCEE